MRTFEVDDDLVELVWARANPRPFEQLSFSDALRQVLGAPSLSPRAPVNKSAEDLLRELDELPTRRPRKRAPKTDLRTLVGLGKLRDGEELVLVDYRRQARRDFTATVSGGDLLYKGRRYSMSALAEQLLKKAGYASDSVRGPEHWSTSTGKLVAELWQEALARNSRTAA